MEKIKNYFRLVRIQNNLITVISVLLGGFVGDVSSWLKLILAAGSASFISAGGYALNDYFDLEIDRINRPERVLPEGIISPKKALLCSISLFASGFIFSLFLKPLSVVMLVAAIIFLSLYSARLKRELLIGNVTVSLICALTFIYGGVFSYNPEVSFIPAIFALLFHMGRELVKDMEDLEGDKALKSETFPIAYGTRNSQLLIIAIFVILIILTIFPYKLNIFSIYYLILVLIIDLILFYIMLSLWNNPSRENLSSLSRLLKFEMLLGLLAIFTGKLI
ncbi:MAG: geranylgeranylglycerol-phosphate geranylgeranyltransferase [candidate division Zixibacteria bacterium]|nr:geranylgeranylglycerol-phosphate geranylgeranyltransferase [candidate division Zixibacteria bacterium]